MKYKRALTESVKLKMLSKVCVPFCGGKHSIIPMQQALHPFQSQLMLTLAHLSEIFLCP